VGNSNTSKNVTPSSLKSNPTPLMSLTLPDPLGKSPSRWQQPSIGNPTPPSSTRNQASAQRNPPNPPNNQPGLLGEYRPPITQTKFGFQKEGPLDLISQSVMEAPSLGVGVGRHVGAGRPAYSEVKRDSLAINRRSFETDPFKSVFASEKFDSVWSGRNPAPTEKLNSLAFRRVEPDPPTSEFDALSKLFTQQPGLLPSNVSLDLASNSSIRFKYNSDRGAMFDNYPASRLDLSRNDFARHDLPRSNASRDDVSRADIYSRPMFSRR